MSNHGRYVMLRKIADGGMAEIFLARQTGEEGFSRLVVVKRILPAYSSDSHFRDMLLDEAHIAMTLNHSNVVPVMDLGRAEGSYFLVMELVDGWDLGQIFDRSVRANFQIPLGLALYVVAEVCRGLGYAHARKDADGKPLSIVHRDVSPQNVLLSEHGEVKVTDFGIAKALGRRDRTLQGMIKGKLDFMSPEQASGSPIDAGSDIFAAGTILYLLCTGLRPFASLSDMEALARVQRADFVPPEEVRPGLSPAVARIMRLAMRADRGERYRTADEMMLDIEAVMRNEFGSPGQSQLKRWLAELSERDGSVALSRRPAVEAGPSLTSQWFAEGEMLSFDDSSKISTTSGAPATGNITSHISSFSTEPPRMSSSARPAAPMGFSQALRRPPMMMPGSMTSRAMARPNARPVARAMPMSQRAMSSYGSMSGIQVDRPAGQHSFLRVVVMLLLLVGAGALVASQVIPKPQQKQLEADARALLQRGVTEVSSAIETWKSRRNESLADKPEDLGVGVERAARGAPPPAPGTGRKLKSKDVAVKTP
jgi:eukaryotic-like serine/threonine-protein kinase